MLEIIQNDNDNNIKEIREFVGERLYVYRDISNNNAVIMMYIKTQDGDLYIGCYDYIVKTKDNEFKVYKP